MRPSNTLLASERFQQHQEALLAVDAHRVAPKLWIGSYPTDPRVCQSFDVIVLCAKEHQTLPFACANVMHVPLDDAKPSSHEVSLAIRAGTAINKLRAQDKRVLVTCAQGVNRSSLVAAIAMVKDGVNPWKAIADIRDRRRPPIGLRPLSNAYFTDLLMRMRA